MLTLFTRTGQIVVNQGVPFLYDSTIGYNSQTGTYNPTNPFIQAEQGVERRWAMIRKSVVSGQWSVVSECREEPARRRCAGRRASP